MLLALVAVSLAQEMESSGFAPRAATEFANQPPGSDAMPHAKDAQHKPVDESIPHFSTLRLIFFHH